MLKKLSKSLVISSDLLVESVDYDTLEKREAYYKRIKEEERDGDTQAHLIFDELGKTFITPFDREDIHNLASTIDDVIDGINSCAKRIAVYNPHPISESGKNCVTLFIRLLSVSKKRWMNSKFSAKNLRICENAVQNCTKSRIRLMMYMNSLSKNCSKRRRTALN